MKWNTRIDDNLMDFNCFGSPEKHILIWAIETLNIIFRLEKDDLEKLKINIKLLYSNFKLYFQPVE